jgi:hypothetical protein
MVQRTISKVNIQVAERFPAVINSNATHRRQEITTVNPTLGHPHVLVGICLQGFRKSMKRLWTDDGCHSNKFHFK